ncbi:hypothetical protein HPP92_008924 [Vanilla planifolia]|uniref:Uncharacterized protein n=1 Tax=Vanilla planifolia TaxID=51239 RepID=A0A835RBD9_VANPL|nr:hypothetical protein HPP92_008924 [Vanilla planifolia]
MQKSGYVQTTPIPNKGKKKQAKVELDRLKQAEKKKRRLEKALAASAAIRSALEKKKQNKLEEEQRLDEEGAAIAESVALYVLLEDSQDPHFMLTNRKSCNSWVRAHNVELMSCDRSCVDRSAKLSGCGADSFAYSSGWNGRDFGMHVNDFYAPYNEEIGQDAGISAVLLAAQAVSSLNIVEDMRKEPLSSQR